MQISFVLPMYNEADNIEAMVAMIRREAAPLLDDYEIVIVNDASTDRCGEMAERMAQDDHRIRVIHHPRNRGLGASIRTGLSASRMQYVLYSDSDLPVDFACLKDVLPRLTPETDLLIGYRLGRAEGIRRAIMSWTYNRLIRWVFGLRVRDVNFAFKIIRRDLLERLDLTSEGSFIDAEMLLEARRAGCHLVEVGLEYHVRRAGVSSLSSPAVVIGILRELWYYLLREKLSVRKEVVVNADDFGLHADVNAAVLEAHRCGVVTSASVLAGGEAFEAAAAIARDNPGLDVGVHLALTEIQPCAPASQIPSLVGADGRFPHNAAALVRRLFTRGIPARQIEAELRAQIERVRARGLPITHLDAHQHVHVLPGVARVVARLAREYGISAVRLPREPISWPRHLRLHRALRRIIESVVLRLACSRAARVFRRAGLVFPDRYFGFANAGHMASTIPGLMARLRPGLTVIGCHPGHDNANLSATFDWGYDWSGELQVLCADSTRAALASSGARLVTWSACRSRPQLPMWTRLGVWGATRVPLLVWFALLALLLSSPVDRSDAYAASVLALGLVIAIISRWFSRDRQRTAAFICEALLLAGLALLAHSLWVTLLAAPAVALAYWRILGGPHVSRAATAKARYAALLTLIILVPCFEAKEEYLEKAHVQQHSAVTAPRQALTAPADRRRPTPSSIKQTRLETSSTIEAGASAGDRE
jgi:hopanoid biosynthesis associated protein HpnK